MNSEKQSTNLQMTLREVNRVGEVKKNIPKLRFKGYEDAWEQRKLASICDVFTDGDWIEAKDQSNSGIRLIQTGNIGTTDYLEKENKKWISEETFEKLHCKEIYEGDILISRLPEPAGRACILPDLGTRMITAVDCTIVRPARDYDNKYVVQYLSTPMYFKTVNSFIGGGTRQRISRGNLSEIGIPIPLSLEEQRSIGDYCSNLDNLITLHQRKYDALKTMKKTLLSKIFPKDGEDVPEIRFKGFTDAWEQRKLGSEFKKVNERNDGTFGKGHWISVAKMYFQAPEKVQSNNIDTRTYVMRLGDIAFEGHPNNEFQFGRFVANDIGDGVVSELFPVYRHKTPYYNNYWKYAIQQERIMAPIFAKSITSSGNSSNKIDPKHFLRQKVRIATLEEQKNIGDFLVEIDNLITLHQRKLEELKNMKKTLLQQMFV